MAKRKKKEKLTKFYRGTGFDESPLEDWAGVNEPRKKKPSIDPGF